MDDVLRGSHDGGSVDAADLILASAVIPPMHLDPLRRQLTLKNICKLLPAAVMVNRFQDTSGREGAPDPTVQ